MMQKSITFTTIFCLKSATFTTIFRLKNATFITIRKKIFAIKTYISLLLRKRTICKSNPLKNEI
jgi:hypothetical protein